MCTVEQCISDLPPPSQLKVRRKCEENDDEKKITPTSEVDVLGAVASLEDFNAIFFTSCHNCAIKKTFSSLANLIFLWRNTAQRKNMSKFMIVSVRPGRVCACVCK